MSAVAAGNTIARVMSRHAPFRLIPGDPKSGPRAPRPPGRDLPDCPTAELCGLASIVHRRTPRMVPAREMPAIKQAFRHFGMLTRRDVMILPVQRRGLIQNRNTPLWPIVDLLPAKGRAE